MSIPDSPHGAATCPPASPHAAVTCPSDPIIWCNPNATGLAADCASSLQAGPPHSAAISAPASGNDMVSGPPAASDKALAEECLSDIPHGLYPKAPTFPLPSHLLPACPPYPPSSGPLVGASTGPSFGAAPGPAAVKASASCKRKHDRDGQVANTGNAPLLPPHVRMPLLDMPQHEPEPYPIYPVPVGQQVPHAVSAEADWLGGSLACRPTWLSPRSRIELAWRLGCTHRDAADMGSVVVPSCPPGHIPNSIIYAWVLTNGNGYWSKKLRTFRGATGRPECPRLDANVKAASLPSIGECVAYLRGAGATTIHHHMDI